MPSVGPSNVPDHRSPFDGPWLSVLIFALSTAGSPILEAKSVQELRAFYAQNCIRCHGRDGSARTPEGKKLGGQDFAQAAKDLRAMNGAASDQVKQTMIRTIQKGIFFGLTMPGWKDQLSQEDATLMVQEILLKAEPGKTIAPDPEHNGPK